MGSTLVVADSTIGALSIPICESKKTHITFLSKKSPQFNSPYLPVERKIRNLFKVESTLESLTPFIGPQC